MEELLNRLKSTPVSLFIGIGLLLAVVYYYMYFDPGEDVTKKTVAAQTEATEVKTKLQETERVIGDRQKFENEYNTVSDQFKAAVEYLPSDFNPHALIKQLYSESRSAGVEVEELKPKAPVPPAADKFYAEIAIDTVVEGSYGQLVLFLAYTSKLKRIVNVRDVEIKFERIVDNVPLLSMKGTFVSYRYAEGK